MLKLDDNLNTEITKLINLSAKDRPFRDGDFDGICKICGVCRMYYSIDMGPSDKYRNFRTGELSVIGRPEGDKYIVFDDGRTPGLTLSYPYGREDKKNVMAYIDFPEGVEESSLNKDFYNAMADIMYLIISRCNMGLMLSFAEISDPQTGIPNILFIRNKFDRIMQTASPADYVAVQLNIRNFKFINETVGSKVGDDVLIGYSRLILQFIEDDEALCRMGGDNFAAIIKKKNLEAFLKTVSSITISELASAPGQEYELTAWIGVSSENALATGNGFSRGISEASAAMHMAKNRHSMQPVYFNAEIDNRLHKSRDIVAAFPKAVESGEIMPFFQAKVDMRTGLLMGFEALARWKHGDSFIYPDQFIPALEKEGLIPELDMAILTGTCDAIRTWREMGLIPPRISTNFSKKNLFIPDIEERILDTVKNSELDPEDIEIEITETLKEAEYDRLVEFVNKLKKYGFHIAVDDFGTGYSSLSLIHNIDVDVIKIDKSFVDKITEDKKSKILIESIVSIVDRLHFSTIAEGVETAEQGRALLEVGCHLAQGYYYSKPVDFEAATELVKNPPFEPI